MSNLIVNSQNKAYVINGNALVLNDSIAYIRGGGSDAGPYIDTGIKPDNTMRVIVWARNWNPCGGALFGGRTALDNAMVSLGSFTGAVATGSIRVDYDNSHSTYTGDQFAHLSGYHKYDLDRGTLRIDDELITTVNGGTFSATSNLYLFCNNNGGTVMSTGLPIDICACKIYKNDVLVRDFKAVNSPSIGLYDSVSKTLFTNAGGGNFTYGIFNLNAYEPLEYIQCNKASYFDSGVYGTYKMRIVSKFRPTGTIARWHTLFGYRTSTSACDMSFGTDTNNQDNMRVYWRFGGNNTSALAFNGSTSNKLTGYDIVAYKQESTATMAIFKNQVSLGSATQSGVSTSFSTDGTIYVAGLNYGSGLGTTEMFEGRIYYLGFGKEKSFVPARVNGVAGLYDTYNDKFYASETDVPFVAGPGKNSYVTSGLVLWLDGIENGGVSGKWIDIIGGHNFDGTATFNSNYVYFNGTSDYLSNSTFSPPVATSGTIEVVFEAEDSGRNRIIFMPKDVSNAIAFGLLKTNDNIIWCITSLMNEYANCSNGCASVNNVRGMNNGESMSIGSTNYWGSPNATYSYIGRRARSSDYAYFKGKVYCIRIYNRQLTEEEMLANYAIDRTRFNL